MKFRSVFVAIFLHPLSLGINGVAAVKIRDRVLFVTAPIKRIDIGATDDKIRVQLEQAPKNVSEYMPSTEWILFVFLIFIAGWGWVGPTNTRRT